MSKHTKLGALVVVGIVLFASGAFIGRQSSTGTTEIIEIEKEQKEKIVYVDKIVTVIREVKPDGTVKETTKTEDRAGTKESQSSESLGSEKVTKEALAQWKVGALYQYEFGNLDLQTSNLQFQGSRRVFGPVFVDAVVGTKSVALGVSIEL